MSDKNGKPKAVSEVPSNTKVTADTMVIPFLITMEAVLEMQIMDNDTGQLRIIINHSRLGTNKHLPPEVQSIVTNNAGTIVKQTLAQALANIKYTEEQMIELSKQRIIQPVPGPIVKPT